MGNQLVGIAPSQIYPVEHYFLGQFGAEITFDCNMGSTRFFKVAKARSEEGLLVVKVFVKHDPTLPLEEHKDRVEYIKKTLSNAVNCLPFQRIEITEKAAYIIREFVKHSLYDRVSTRPFLTVLEKKWITFQILCALNQCHKHKICHGDIKLENILITSWNWILLSDFASFKPTYLPEDNPADYTYFFDTSRRRTCYIAPERFVKTLSSDDADSTPSGSMLPTNSIVRLGSYYSGDTLLPSMDIFSAGCALLELWTEGTAPFELSQLLAYRREERELVKRHLQGIENENLHNLLASMIDLNPANRKSAEDYLDQERGHLFPEYFYSFLQSYLQMFSSAPIMSPDDKIIRLHSDIDHCIKVLTKNEENVERKENDETGELDVNAADTKDINENPPSSSPLSSTSSLSSTSTSISSHSEQQDGLILIITVVTSCIRGLQYSKTMIYSLEILQKLSQYTTSETILDRILPYILHLVQTSSTKVQVQAIDTLTNCLNMVKDIPLSDANVFPEYILPSITKLADCEHSAVIVRVAFARNIAKLAKIAIYFLEETQRNAPNDMTTRRYEAELNALHDIISLAVLNLLTDPKAVVKQTLMESNISDLCAFFGKEKANDIILSHITTFLNDDDKNLRGSFYDNIAGVAGYIGWQVADILVPLLQQGFTDREDFVITKAIRAVTILIELGHIKKPIVTDIIKDVSCYLCHPNLWIRHEICGLLSTTARTYSAIDVQCKIMPAISKFLKIPLIQVEKPDILLDCLQPPIPSQIFESILSFGDIHKFIYTLEARASARNNATNTTRNTAANLPTKSHLEDAEPPLSNLFRRLISEGLTDQIEDQLLAMKGFLVKLKYKALQHENDDLNIRNNGRIFLSHKTTACHEFPLIDNKLSGITKASTSSLSDTRCYDGLSAVTPASDVTMSSGVALTGSPSSAMLVLGQHPTTAALSATTSLGEYTLPEKNYMQEHPSECRRELDELCAKLKTRYNVMAMLQRKNHDNRATTYPNNWRMSGTLVAHLHEHSESVIKLTSLKSNGPLFASGSVDGTIRLWDANKLSSNQGINKSRQVCPTNTPIYSLAACDNGQSLAVGGKDGSLLIMRLDRNSSKMALQQALHLDENANDGPVVDMYAYEQNPQSIIIYATLYGSIVAWDTRMQNSAWRLQNDLRHGVITTICADPTGSWLAIGTSGGKHIGWDLRFRLPITEIKHPADSWIRKIACHPTKPSFLISASQSNNEVSIWNIETGYRDTVLWASTAPVLSYTNINDPATTCGILSGVVDNEPFILTGSSDQRIRFWDIAQPRNSALVVPSARDNLNDTSFIYDSHLIDGNEVIREKIINLNMTDMNSIRPSIEENPRSGPELPSVSHHDAITDLLMCKTDKGQVYIASASRDGVIKLWK